MALLEGVRLVEEAMALGLPFRGAIVSPDLRRTERGMALERALETRGVPLEPVDAELLIDLADTETPQGVIAVVEPPTWRLDQVVLGARGAVLALDGVQDPGNVGALVRTAYGLGAAATVALTGTVDVLNPKALRGAAGATFRLPVVAATHAELAAWLEANGCVLWLGDRAGAPVGRVARPARVVVAVGNEGAGLSPALRALPHERVAIPLVSGAESLNVAVAAGILLYEVMRGG